MYSQLVGDWGDQSQPPTATREWSSRTRCGELMITLGATLSLLATRLPRPPLCACATVGAQPLAHEAGAAEVVGALFGSVSSRQAFGRQAMSLREIEEDGRDARARELTYGEFDLDFFWELLRATAPRPAERFVDVGSGCGRL
eukprot:6281127-Prymnesium_polylepis.1